MQRLILNKYTTRRNPVTHTTEGFGNIPFLQHSFCFSTEPISPRNHSTDLLRPIGSRGVFQSDLAGILLDTLDTLQ